MTEIIEITYSIKHAINSVIADAVKSDAIVAPKFPLHVQTEIGGRPFGVTIYKINPANYFYDVGIIGDGWHIQFPEMAEVDTYRISLFIRQEVLPLTGSKDKFIHDLATVTMLK